VYVGDGENDVSFPRKFQAKYRDREGVPSIGVADFLPHLEQDAAMTDIADWLGELGMSAYTQSSAENDIDFSLASKAVSSCVQPRVTCSTVIGRTSRQVFVASAAAYRNWKTCRNRT
jgi:hypothetical protein